MSSILASGASCSGFESWLMSFCLRKYSNVSVFIDSTLHTQWTPKHLIKLIKHIHCWLVLERKKTIWVFFFILQIGQIWPSLKSCPRLSSDKLKPQVGQHETRAAQFSNRWFPSPPSPASTNSWNIWLDERQQLENTLAVSRTGQCVSSSISWPGPVSSNKSTEGVGYGGRVPLHAD